MLQILRDRTQGFFAWAVILVIAGIFAFLGLSDFFGARVSVSDAAIVDGEPISWRSVDQIYQRVLHEQEVSSGSEQALKSQIIATLAQRLAFQIGLKSQGFILSPEQVVDILKKTPAFAVDGKFSKEQFKLILAQAGYGSEAIYLQDLSQDLLRNQLTEGLSASALDSQQDLKQAVQLLDQTRNLGYIILPANQYHAEVSGLISAEAIKQYYDAHQSQFVFPEQVALDYIELSVDGLMTKIPATTTDLQAFYEQNPALFSKPEQVHARHILISSLSKDDQHSKVEADALLAKIKQGEEFGPLAKAKSEDTISAKEGGDLGWFGRGEMVPEFEKAVFELKKSGDIAGPIQTNYGYHIIQLIDRKEAEKRSFADSKALVEEHYRRTKAEALFVTMKEQWAKLTRDNPGDVKPIADALGLTVETTALFARQTEDKDKTDAKEIGIAAHPEIRKAAFGPNVLVNGKNSELIALNEGSEVPDKHLVMVHLNKHQVARSQSLEEAEPKVRALLVSKRATEKAKEMADALVLSLKASTASEQSPEAKQLLSELSTKHQLKWITRNNITRDNQELDRAIIVNAFKLPAPDEKTGPSANGFALTNGDYVVLTVNKVRLGDADKIDAGTRDAYQKKLKEMNHQIEFGLYVNEILSKAKVKFFEMADDAE